MTFLRRCHLMAGRKACNYFGRGMRDPGRGNSKCISPRLWSMCDQQRCLRDTQSSYISESDASTSAMADFPAWAVSKLSSPFKLIFRGLQQSPSGILLFLPVCGLPGFGVSRQHPAGPRPFGTVPWKNPSGRKSDRR